jgi:hypothetical protein
LSTSGATITTAIYYNGAVVSAYFPSATAITSLPAATTSYTANFIGKGIPPDVYDVNLDAYLNDVKIFNFALSPAQALAQYNSELCNVYFYKKLFIF